MTEQVKMWACKICKRVYYAEEEAQICEKKHDKFEEVKRAVTKLFHNFFPAIAERRYFVYAYGTHSFEKIAVLDYDCHHCDFARGVIYLSFKMVIRDKICTFKCEPAIEIEDEDPLKAVREFVSGEKDVLSFQHPERTHPNVHDWLSIVLK